MSALTVNKLNAHIMSGRTGKELFPLAKRIECVDGFNISVQANEACYCQPRDNKGPWYEVECGYPSSVPELIMGHCEDASHPCTTVYAYVPIHLVAELLDLHGGIKEEQP